MKNYELPWSEFKAALATHDLQLKYFELNNTYHIYAYDGPFYLFCQIFKDSGTEQAEFEASFKPLANRPIASRSSALFNSESYRFRGQGTALTICPAGQTTDVDILPHSTEDRFVDGGFLVHVDANHGDKVSFKVVHPLAGVVEVYVVDWLVVPGTGVEEIKVYPAKIPAGFKLRVSYTNVGTTDAKCGINYRLHKKG